MATFSFDTLQRFRLPIQNWNEAMAYFLIKFDDRIQINN